MAAAEKTQGAAGDGFSHVFAQESDTSSCTTGGHFPRSRAESRASTQVSDMMSPTPRGKKARIFGVSATPGTGSGDEARNALMSRGSEADGGLGAHRSLRRPIDKDAVEEDFRPELMIEGPEQQLPNHMDDSDDMALLRCNSGTTQPMVDVVRARTAAKAQEAAKAEEKRDKDAVGVDEAASPTVPKSETWSFLENAAAAMESSPSRGRQETERSTMALFEAHPYQHGNPSPRPTTAPSSMPVPPSPMNQRRPPTTPRVRLTDFNEGQGHSFANIKSFYPFAASINQADHMRRRASQDVESLERNLAAQCRKLCAVVGAGALVIIATTVLIMHFVAGAPALVAAVLGGVVEACVLMDVLHRMIQASFPPSRAAAVPEPRPRIDSLPSAADGDREDVEPAFSRPAALNRLAGFREASIREPPPNTELVEDEACDPDARSQVTSVAESVDNEFVFVTLKDITVVCAMVKTTTPDIAMVVNVTALIVSVLREVVFVIIGDRVIALFDGPHRLENGIKRCFELQQHVASIKDPEEDTRQQASLHIGVCAEGQMLSGRVSHTFAFFSEAADIARLLSDLCQPFEVSLLLAAMDPPVFQDHLISTTQVDFLSFSCLEDPIPIYTVQQVGGDVNDSLTLEIGAMQHYAVDESVTDACTAAWGSIRDGAIMKGKKAITALKSRAPWVQAMKRRVAALVTVSHYHVTPQVSTALASRMMDGGQDAADEDDLLGTTNQDLNDLEDESEKRMLYMVVYMPERKYMVKLKEIFISFIAAVARFDGEVDHMASDRYSARWRVEQNDRNSLAKVANAVRYITQTLPQPLHMGLAFGSYTTLTSKGIKTIISDGRNRATCLALLAYNYHMTVVAEANVLMPEAQQAGNDGSGLTQSLNLRRASGLPPDALHTKENARAASVSNPLVASSVSPQNERAAAAMQSPSLTVFSPLMPAPLQPKIASPDDDDDARSCVSDDSSASCISNARYMSVNDVQFGSVAEMRQANHGSNGMLLCRKLTSTAFYSFVETFPVQLRRRRTGGGAMPPKVRAETKGVVLFEVITEPQRAASHNTAAGLYGKALRRIRDRSWEKAREILNLYNSAREVDQDPWAAFLLFQVRQAIQDEEGGIRGSDDDLEFHINMLGEVETFQQADPDDSSFGSSSSLDAGRQTPQFVEGELRVNAAESLNSLDSSSRRRGGARTPNIMQTPRRSLRVMAETPKLTPRMGTLMASQDRMRARSPQRLSSARERSMHSMGAEEPANEVLLDRKRVREYLGMAVSVYRHMHHLGQSMPLYNAWNSVRLALLTIDCIVTPARAASLSHRSFDPTTVFFIALGYLTDLVYLVDIVQNFHEPVTNDLGVLISDPREIRMIYLTGWFFPDIIGMFPWELLYVLITKTPATIARHPQVRLNRLVNMLRMPSLTYVVTNAYFPEVHPVLTKVFVHVFVVLMILFWIGCLWNFTTGNELHDHQRDTLFEQSLRGFHWSLRGFAGYGQPWPAPDAEYLPALINVIFGIGAFATVIAYCHSTLGMTHDSVFMERLDEVVQASEELKVGKDTTISLLRYHRMLWEKTGQVYRGQFDDLMNELPRELSIELTYYANIRALQQIPSLMAVDDYSYITHLACKLVHYFGFPSETLYEQGEPFRETFGIYFLIKGQLKAVANNAVIETITPGSYWGELSCMNSMPQPASLVVTDYSDIYFLPYSTFRDFFEQFPAAAEAFVENSNRRRQKIMSSVTALEEEVNAKTEDEDSLSHSDAGTVAFHTPVMRGLEDTNEVFRSLGRGSFSPSLRAPSGVNQADR